MDKICKICGKVELPLTKNKLGILIAAMKYCKKCGHARTKVLCRRREDKKNLIRHYELLKGQLDHIEDLKKLIDLGKDENLRTKELLDTGKGYWEDFNLAKYHRSNKKTKKSKEEIFKTEILGYHGK